MPAIIDAITWAVIYSHFANAVPDGLHIARVPTRQTVKSLSDSSLGACVS